MSTGSRPERPSAGCHRDDREQQRHRERERDEAAPGHG